MTLRDLVSKISGVDYLMVYKNDEFICHVSKEDLDKGLSVLDSEVCSVEVVIYDGWGDDGTGERFIGFTSHLKIGVKQLGYGIYIKL